MSRLLILSYRSLALPYSFFSRLISSSRSSNFRIRQSSRLDIWNLLGSHQIKISEEDLLLRQIACGILPRLAEKGSKEVSLESL